MAWLVKFNQSVLILFVAKKVQLVISYARHIVKWKTLEVVSATRSETDTFVYASIKGHRMYEEHIFLIIKKQSVAP